jgi:hypothetical protein
MRAFSSTVSLKNLTTAALVGHPRAVSSANEVEAALAVLSAARELRAAPSPSRRSGQAEAAVSDSFTL